MVKQILCSFISLMLIACSSIENPPISQAKTEINTYLNKNYPNQFNIDSICKDFGHDMFNLQAGFEVWLSDSVNIKFGPIFFQKNKCQHGWITYRGSDIEKEYHEAQRKDSTSSRKK